MTPDDAVAWRQEMAAINLARLRWAIPLVGGLAMLFLVLAPILLEGDTTWTRRAYLDLAAAAVCFGLVTWARRQPRDSPWRMRVVWLCLAAWLVDTNLWFFESLALFGQNSDYVVGVILMTVIALAPPRPMAVAFALNHTLFCLGLLLPERPEGLVIVALLDGTIVASMAWLLGWLMYRARESEFVRARALAASNAELREVMAIAAHELRSPLLGIRDLLTLARQEPGVETTAMARALDLASASCGEMARLVSRLVDTHVMETGDRQMALAPHDLREACAAVNERLRGSAQAKGQRLALALPDTPAIARIDTAAFVQVFENLVGNALKFSPPGSDVECALFARGNRWCLEVRDQGPSVPIEERGRLFQKFYRGTARPTGGESSTGLGLFIVKRLTEAMGGRVSHDARRGRGSIFTVELPAA